MGSNKTEAVAGKSTITSDHLSFGKLRFQVYQDNQTHIHDDEQKLVFVWKDAQAFRLAMESFIKNHAYYPAEFVVRSEVDPKDKTRNFGDILFKRGKQWSMTVVPAGTPAKDEIGREPALEFIDNFIQRY